MCKVVTEELGLDRGGRKEGRAVKPINGVYFCSFGLSPPLFFDPVFMLSNVSIL